MPLNFFVGLKAQMYTYISEDSHESKRAKVIYKNVVEVEIKFEDYKNALFNWVYMRHNKKRVQSKDHNMGTYKIHKVSLLP